MLFENRKDAGKKLAPYLKEYKQNSIILALPRGGVPVAYQISRLLKIPLSVVVTRKIGAPHHPELGVGAISENNVRIIDSAKLNALSISKQSLEPIIRKEEQELQRRLSRYRKDRPLPDFEGLNVILVDDGVATGVTAEASIEAVRKNQPEKIVFAAPVGAKDSIDIIRNKVEELICPHTPRGFGSVGQYYKKFQQTDDGEVIELLDKAEKEVGSIWNIE